MLNFYFTFGIGQTLGRNYVRIEANSMEEARTQMIHHHGSLWAFSYTEEEFLPQIERYGLSEVPLGTVNRRIS